MFWAQRPAQCERREVGAAMAARGVHGPSLLEALQAQGALGAELPAQSLLRVSPSPLSGDGSGGSRC